MLKWISTAAMIAMLAAGCSGGTRRATDNETRFEIAVTDAGFAPASITIPAGKAVTLVVTRKTDQTCAKEIVFPDQGIHKLLPLNEAVEISLPASSRREMTFVCGMNMITGKVLVQ